MNIFTPERQAGETQQQYRARRVMAKTAALRMTKGPTQARALPFSPPPNWIHWWLGQHTNPVKNARRAAIKAAGGFRHFSRSRSAA